MSEDTKVDTAAKPPAAPKKKKQTLIIVGVVIAIVIVIALLVANATIQSQPQATANIQVMAFNTDQSYLGPTTFNVTVSNVGSASGIGIRILLCRNRLRNICEYFSVLQS